MRSRMKNFNIIGFPEKSNFQGGSRKTNIQGWTALNGEGGGEIGQFADLRGDLLKKKGVVVLRQGVDTTMHFMNHKQNYLSENVLCSKNDKIVTEIYLKSLGTKKR